MTRLNFANNPVMSLNAELLLYLRVDLRGSSLHTVQWLEDVIKADPFFGRAWVRFRVPPWVSNTVARDHLVYHRRRPCKLRAIV